MPSKKVIIDYTNWLGKRRKRVIDPMSIRFGTTQYHQEPMWLLLAIDVAEAKLKEFAMKDIHSWEPVDA